MHGNIILCAKIEISIRGEMKMALRTVVFLPTVSESDNSSCSVFSSSNHWIRCNVYLLKIYGKVSFPLQGPYTSYLFLYTFRLLWVFQDWRNLLNVLLIKEGPNYIILKLAHENLGFIWGHEQNQFEKHWFTMLLMLLNIRPLHGNCSLLFNILKF